MNHPLGNLIFRIIEEALDQDVKRRTGQAPSAPDAGSIPESKPMPPVKNPQPVRDFGELKDQLKRKEKASLGVPERTYKTKPKPETRDRREENPDETVELVRPSSPTPTAAAAMRDNNTSALRRWMVGQIVLGPCKALEETRT